VMIELEHAALDRNRIVEALGRRGVRMGPSGPRRIRAIVHLDIDDAGVERAITAFREALEESLAAAGSRS